MKPTPQKPRIIIAHVDGSGTAEVTDDPFWAMASSGVNSISSPPKLKVPKLPHPFPHGIDVVKLSVKRGAETAVALMPPVPMEKFTPAWNPAEVPPTVSSTPSKPVEASPPNVVSVRSWVWLLIVMLVGENAVPGDLRDWFAESPVNVPFDVSKVNTTEKLSPARLPPPNKFSPSVLELTPPTEELTLEIVPLYVTLTMSADADKADTCKNAAVNNKPSVADFIVVIFTPKLNEQQNNFNFLAARPKSHHNKSVY
jgi:hypothetical protein